jgi:hypothetical protein
MDFFNYCSVALEPEREIHVVTQSIWLLSLTCLHEIFDYKELIYAFIANEASTPCSMTALALKVHLTMFDFDCI